MPSETMTAGVSLLVFFRIRRGTFPYSVEDDASTKGQTPTTHYTNTCVKLTIVTHPSFSERIAIANLTFYLFKLFKGVRFLLITEPFARKALQCIRTQMKDFTTNLCERDNLPITLLGCVNNTRNSEE